MKLCLYNNISDNEDENIFWDVYYILNSLNVFAESLGIEYIDISPAKINQVVKMMRNNFPCLGGKLEDTSAFKKAGYFAACFISQSPIQTALPTSAIGKLAEIQNHQNALFAFIIAVDCLHGAKIKKVENTQSVTEEIQISIHSFFDIIDALSSDNILQNWRLITVLLEQLTYKTNSHCQYDEMASLWLILDDPEEVDPTAAWADPND